MSGKKAVLTAFDRLFDRAASKLEIECDEDARAEAKRSFEERFAPVLELVSDLKIGEFPEEVIRSMESAIDDLSPAQVVSHLASLPLAHQAQQLMQRVTYRAAEQRLLEQLISQADESYGGN